MNNKIDVVLVTYNPDIEMLMRCVASISIQVRKIWIIDNNSADSNISNDLTKLYENIEILRMSENKGIAHAQNIGIKKSLENQSDYILLSDQDTSYPDHYVNNMTSVFAKYHDELAAVAPLFHDVVGKNKNEGFFVISKFGYSKIFPSKGTHDINQAIASGLLIKSRFFEKIGLMNEELFIDWVDYEWSWRVVNLGYKILGNADILIEHSLGDRTINLGLKRVNFRSPPRHYYITRNAFHLAWRSPYLNIWHRLSLISKGISYIVGYSVLAKPRMSNLKMTLLGFYHSLIGRLGRLD